MTIINRSLMAGGDESPSSLARSLDPSSSFPSSRPRRHTSLDATQRPGQVYRARSASNILDSTDDFHKRLYDPQFAPHLQRPPTSKQDGLADLVHFLKNQAPPSDNFMSIPDEGADEERRRWLKWVKLAKRNKPQPRAPPQIRLPDTAVSGTTIGGHRHIAITIPFEALPMGESPRSQYPVYKHGLGGERPSTSPVRTVVNEKGVVTVLKTVNEDREGSMLSSHRPSSSSYSQSSSVPRTASRGGRQSIHGFFTAPPSRGSMANAHEQAYSARTAHQGNSAFPARGSSMMNRSLHQHISLDGLLSQPGTAGSPPAKEGSSNTPGAQATKKDDQLLKPKKSVKVKPTPVAVDGTPTDKAIDGDMSGDDAPPTPMSTASRKERVRDRKRRDIEALKSAKQKKEHGEEHADTESRCQFSPVRVVVNWEPDEPSAELPLTPSQPDSSQPSGTKEEFTTLPLPLKDAQPTPPLSPLTPAKKHNNLDRTSLSRRREWKATREQERRSKETRAAVRQRARELATGRTDDLDDSPQTLDKEILRLYEAYREHRFRDMERRVRRLERNGDVWLRALVPVLDNLNHNIAAEGLNDRAYMSDGEPAQKQKITVPIRRANSSHKTLREEELEHRNGEEDGGYESDGFDTIEPLMRELAGAARARQMKMNGGLLRAG